MMEQLYRDISVYYGIHPSVGFAYAIMVGFHLFIILVVCLIGFILLIVFRKQEKIKNKILIICFYSTMFIQLYSLIALYQGFGIYRKPFDFIHIFNFFLFFGIRSLIYYIPIGIMFLFKWILMFLKRSDDNLDANIGKILKDNNNED